MGGGNMGGNMGGNIQGAGANGSVHVRHTSCIPHPAHNIPHLTSRLLRSAEENHQLREQLAAKDKQVEELTRQLDLNISLATKPKSTGSKVIGLWTHHNQKTVREVLQASCPHSHRHGTDAERCAAGAPLYVHKMYDGHGNATPVSFSHVIALWLPSLFSCVDALPTCSRLIIDWTPFMPRAMYRDIVEVLAPHMTLVDANFTLATWIGSRLSPRLPASCLVSCGDRPRHTEALLTGFRRPAISVAGACEDAGDIVFVRRGIDRHDANRQPWGSGAASRDILNADEAFSVIVKVARRHGLSARAVTFETLSFREQIAATCRVKVLVGQHGAGLAHVLWSRAAKRIVIELPPWSRRWWSAVFKANGIEQRHSERHSVFAFVNQSKWRARAKDAPADLDVSRSWPELLRAGVLSLTGNDGPVAGLPYGLLHVNLTELEQDVETAVVSRRRAARRVHIS